MRATGTEAAFLTLGFLILSAGVGLIVRVSMRWGKIESNLRVMTETMEKIVRDKDEIHKEIIRQMTHDRKAANKRLRFLEQRIWKKRNK